MAKPDLDDGWLPYAHELDAALAVAVFTRGARIVLREVFAQIFGLAKLKTAVISPSVIAEKCGVSREQISRGVKELVDSAVLVKVGEGEFRFIKDYESWLHKGQPRLTKKEAEYCRLSVTKKPRKTTTPPVTDQSQNRDGSVTPPVTDQSQNRDGSVTPPVTDQSQNRDGSVTPPVTDQSQNRDGSVTPPVTDQSQNRDGSVTPPVTDQSQIGMSPYRNAHAEFEIKREGRFKTHKEIAGVCVSTNGSEPIPIEDSPPSPLPQVDPAALARVAAKADRLFPELYFGSKVHGTACSFPLAWIDRALEDMHATGAASWPYLLKILRRWSDQGGPDTRASPSGRASWQEKSKVQDDAFAALDADPEFLKACDQIKGA